MVTWTLADIKTKVRDLTGRKSTTQLSDADLGNYINNFYQYILPNELQLRINKGWLVASTVAGDDTINISETSRVIRSPATINGNPINIFTDPNTFFDKFPRPDHHTSGMTTSTSSSKLVNANATFISDGVAVGDFVKNVTDGTTSSVLTVDSDTQLTLNDDIFTTDELYEVTLDTSEPSDVLLYASGGIRRLIFRPVPDKVYEFRAALFTAFGALSNDTSSPAEDGWGPFIAYGTAIDIFMDNGERAEADNLGDMYHYHLNLVMRAQHITQSQSRAWPKF